MNLLKRLQTITYAAASSEIEKVAGLCNKAAAAGSTEIAVPAKSISEATLSYLRDEGLQVYEQYGNILISWR
jgi:chaperonin GroEL (HSP60 family)